MLKIFILTLGANGLFGSVQEKWALFYSHTVSLKLIIHAAD